MGYSTENSRKVRSSTFRDSRSAIEIQLPTALEFQRDSFVLEVVKCPVIQLLAIVFRKSRLGVEVAVMVACDDNLLSMRQGRQPVKLLLYLFDIALVCQVSSMNQHITTRYGDGVSMCVRDANNLDFRLVSRWKERRPAEAEKEGVNNLDKSSEGESRIKSRAVGGSQICLRRDQGHALLCFGGIVSSWTIES